MNARTPNVLKQRLELLDLPQNRALLMQGLRGIEREALRVNVDGCLNISNHPVELGSTLTHPQITTDYSESLLEFITPAVADAGLAIEKLTNVHRYTYTKLDGQLIWSQSMPCELPSEAEIPIAWYGVSHIGMLKHVYRRGLALRYGKAMQCIAGIHYNISLADGLWSLLNNDKTKSSQDIQSEGYIALIRNFHRYSWLLMYLFGASPALASSFLKGRDHALEKLSDDTLYLPYATSLRMSDLGYQNNAQDGLVPPYNTLHEYMSSLSKAVRKPYAPYAAIGTQKEGEWVQINTNFLQIENEFYATIRPKRVINSGERPIEALCERGVQYVEVRCMDVDPFEAVGISLETARFIDVFVMFCALSDSPLTNDLEGAKNVENFARTVKLGRQPGLQLNRGGEEIGLQSWGLQLIEQMTPIATMLDERNGGVSFTASLATQKDKLFNSEHTPSAKVLKAIIANGGSFKAFGLKQSEVLAAQLSAEKLNEVVFAEFEQMAADSIAAQAKIEHTQIGSFDDFIADYGSRTSEKVCSG